MGLKEPKNKAKLGIMLETATTTKPAANATQPAPVKKKKHNPFRPQPAWLFPPEDENPIFNTQGKSGRGAQKEIDERLAATKFLGHISVTLLVRIVLSGLDNNDYLRLLLKSWTFCHRRQDPSALACC